MFNFSHPIVISVLFLTLHYITKNFIAENHHHYTILKNVIHFYIFQENKNISCNSSMTTAILPFRGYSRFYRCVPSSAQHMKNRVNGSICVKMSTITIPIFPPSE